MEQHSEVNQNTRTIGRMLLEAGKLKPEDADSIVKAQKQFGLRFGDAAVKLGLITENDILQTVSHQFDYSCLSMDDHSVDHKIIAAFQAYGHEVEAFRGIRSQLSLRWFAENRSLVITAPRKGQGASYIAANLAVMFAQLGQKTLLIDADMRNPSQQANFNGKGKTGLSDLLAKRAGLESIQSVKGLANLSLLEGGTIPPNPLELLGHARFSKLLIELEEQFEIIIIDSPAMQEFSDAQVLSSITKGALIVAGKNETSIADIEAIKQQIIIAGAEPVGVVLNNIR